MTNMTVYCLVSPDGIIEEWSTKYIKFDPLIPTGKGRRWLPVVKEDFPETFNPLLENSVKTYVVGQDAVTEAWVVSRKSLAEQKQAVKDECNRRIVSVHSLTKQLNMLARAVEITGIPEDQRTAEEIAEANYLQAQRDWIKTLRTKSDLIENMNPIPDDFNTNNSYWE